MQYSKRYIKGLPKPKEIVIKSLSEYMKVMDEEKYKNYVFRGEPTNYDNTISSALRGKEIPFIKMKNEYKREIYHRLTEDERENFLAFSQHHGLPTNLIDFTRAPIVALYFACQPFSSEDESYDKERGFVYLLQDDLIDITDLVRNNEDENFLIRFIYNRQVLKEVYRKLVVFEISYPEKFYYYFKTLSDDWKYYTMDFQTGEQRKSRFPKYNNGDYDYEIKWRFIVENQEIIDEIERETGECVCFKVLEYILMLRDFLKWMLESKVFISWLNFIPNFLYTPYLSFERGRNQQGLFVYQTYLSYDEDVYGAHVLARQRVWPETVIVIENKEHILKELDFLGINEKFIYEDYDSIARYIKKKYEV